MASRSRRTFCARFASNIAPSEIKGRRECRAPDAPDSRVCAGRKQKAHALVRSHRNHPAFPAQWFTAYFALSPATGLSCHRRPRKLPFANLTPASGRQDHTSSPSASAPFVIGASASTASRLASVTIANRPSVRRDGESYSLIWVSDKQKYFCERGWTEFRRTG
jgi:hypothetical protein